MTPFSEVRTIGIDVSHGQGEIDRAAVKQNGIAFAFMKATDGHGSIPKRFSMSGDSPGRLKHSAIEKGRKAEGRNASQAFD